MHSENVAITSNAANSPKQPVVNTLHDFVHELTTTKIASMVAFNHANFTQIILKKIWQFHSV